MIRAVIIDDEDHCIQTLKWQLEKFKDRIELIGSATSGTKGIELINQHRPDLVFLDIEMPNISGFDVLQKLDKYDVKIIFTTAYDEYAVRAFRVSATDYLLKPIRPDFLAEAIDRITNTMEEASSQKIDTLIHNLSHQIPGKQKLALPSMDGLDFVKIDDILYCEAERNYTRVVQSNGKQILISKTLKDVSDILQTHSFLRTHKSYLINLTHVVRYVRTDGGYAVMTNGDSISVARGKKEEFLQAFARI